MSPLKINPVVDTFRGINNALNPCSAQYRQFMAYVCKNSRINDSGIWDKAAALGNVASGATQRDIIDDFSGATNLDLHFNECFINGTQYIVGGLNAKTNIDVGPNKMAYYADPDLLSGAVKWWDGSATGGEKYGLAGLGRPDANGIAVADNGGGLKGGRMQRGVYYYMYTYYDTAREVESLPSTVTDWVCSAWTTANSVDSAIYPTITITHDASHSPSVGDAYILASTRVRVYRTKRTYEPDREINAPNEFFFIGDLAYSAGGMTINDFAHDSELVDRYEGRGTPPLTGVDCLASFENRMYYFIGNVVYWSSSGRPGEVALQYTLTYKTRNPAGGARIANTFPMMPLMAGGIQGEAKYEISELAGQTVIGAYPYNGKLWLWTDSMVGYLRPTLSIEGVKFYLVRKGLGLISSKTLAHTPYGLFGADREGVWLLDNYNALSRLSKGVIDIDDSTKTTYFLQSTLVQSFGVWVPALSEYWWCAVNTGETVVHRQLAYQPLRKLFGGVYEYSSLTGGCTMITAGGAQCYLTGGKTPSKTSVATDMQQQLDFWMGQHSLGSVKDNVKVEIIYESITTGQSVTVVVYQNNLASTTGATNTDSITHDENNLVGYIHAKGSGRMFLIRITTTNNATHAPVIAINYIANHITWSEKHGR